MSDYPGPHHPIAEALATAREEAAARNHNSSSGSSGGGGVGGGIGNLSGWIAFFGLIGGTIGAFATHGIGGALVGAAVFGGCIAVVGFIGQKTARIWNRGPVIAWVGLGALAGVVLGVMMNSDPVGWAVAGMMALGAFRSVTKD